VAIRSVVIVPVDGSRETDRTLEFAVRIAKRRAADVHAIQVVRRDGGTSRLRALPPSGEHDGMRMRRVTLRGTPERVIPAYAQLHTGSVIVVGRTYGSSWLWRNSAVATRLSRSSPVPVFVVPAVSEAAASVSWNRIVAAVDFTVASAIALRTAVDLSKRHGARLTLVHAMNPIPGMVFSGRDARRLVQGLPADTTAMAERLRKDAIGHGADNVEPVVVTSNPDRGILEVAVERDADLIVMGVAPRHWLDQMAFGSTLRAVVRRAKIPVLVLPVIAGGHELTDVSNREDAREPRAFGDRWNGEAA
jgi:nucleotide-binding universal stress UspA family protein